VQRGDARAARATFERLVARDKTVIAARARIELGKLAADAGDHEQALADFLKVALLYANDDEVAEASFLAGQSLEALGQNDRALERYRDVVAKQPRSPFARRAEQRVRELAVR
jgi:TolA-binding protein